MYAWWAKVHWILKSWTWLSNRAHTDCVWSWTLFFPLIWELMEQYMSKYADWHHHFYWLQWSQRTHGELIWRWHNWFRSDLAKRDTVACIQSLIESFIQQTCQRLAWKENQDSVQILKEFTVLSQSLWIFLFCGPTCLSSCCPLCPCPESPRSSFVPGSSQALFTDPPPTPFPSPLLPLGLTVA